MTEAPTPDPNQTQNSTVLEDQSDELYTRTAVVYDPTGPKMTVSIDICNRCFAMVGNRRAHTSWHEKLNQEITSAGLGFGSMGGFIGRSGV